MMRRRSSRAWTVSLFLVLARHASGGLESDTSWHELAQCLPIEGKGWVETGHPFDRLPAKAKEVVRPPVWTLAQDSAGLRFRFVTDADALRARWSLRRTDRLAMTHMPASGVSGVDLYIRDAGRWRWLAVGRPEDPALNECLLVSGLGREKREYLLYLPLYNGIGSIELGLPAGAVLQPAPARYSLRPAIVFYGTSVLQGGCASRPGMAYPSILGRRLDWPTVNLGFSGNGKAEPEMAQLVAELDPAAFVVDTLGNLDVTQANERMEPFIKTLRARHPTTAIVLVEGINYADTSFIESLRIKVAERNGFLRKLYDRMRAGGDRHIHYVPSSHLLGGDGDDTVDGTHPTDLGFLRMADGMEPVLREALRGAGFEVPEKNWPIRTLSTLPSGEGKPAPHSPEPTRETAVALVRNFSAAI